MKQNETNLTPKNAKIFHCEKCNFTSCKQSEYVRHLSTRKHKMKQNETNLTPKNAVDYFCKFCEKKFNSRTTLWRHNKKCDGSVSQELVTTANNSEICKQMLPLMKEMMTEIAPILQPHNTTNNNQNFNINIFLNEQCKDAMNISDFIESIQLSIEDMTKIGTEGQTKGMSNILIDKLNSLDVVKRPMHCSDIKKETIYIKDEDQWQMENKNKPKLIEAIDKLSVKSIKTLDSIEDDPEIYIQAASEVLKEPLENKKIISSIAKEVCI
jgi:hypothetical protein